MRTKMASTYATVTLAYVEENLKETIGKTTTTNKIH